MPDYKETEVVGRQYQRCSGIFIDNPRGGTPTIRMQEELVALVGDNTFSQTAAGLAFAFDPAESIELIDPSSGQPTGQTTSGMALYVALYSLYLKKAHERDAAAATG